jgi:hypothetical protein
MSQGGNLITTYSDGTFTMVSPSTGSVVTGHGTPPAAASGGIAVTQAQASAWPALISSLTAAGVKLGTVAMLQPGQTLLPNGTVLGTGQSLVGPAGSINAQLAGIYTNPLFLAGAGGILLLALVVGGRR